MIKKYNVTVNGLRYEVEVEEAGTAAVPSPAAPVSRPAAPPAVGAPKPGAAGGGRAVLSPMPGTVLSLNAVPGQRVKAGDILLILEAMKMENEIMAPVDGTVETVNTTKGASVNTGDVLVTLNESHF